MSTFTLVVAILSAGNMFAQDTKDCKILRLSLPPNLDVGFPTVHKDYKIKGHLENGDWTDILALKVSCNYVTQAVATENLNLNGYAWKNCERNDLGRVTIPFNRDGTFRPECAPDTLYSWQTQEKIQKFVKNLTPENILPFEELYTWRTPIASFGYANSSVRLKLKPNVKFQLIDGFYAHNCSKSHAENTIFVYATKDGYSEYYLCSSGPIESWSYGTKEHLDEMKSEMAWIRTHSEFDYDLLSKSNQYSMCAGMSCLNFYANSYLHFNDPNFAKTAIMYPLGFSIPDPHTDWTEQRLSANLHIMQTLSDQDFVKIFYAVGVTPDSEKHFATKTPSYFNPRADH